MSGAGICASPSGDAGSAGRPSWKTNGRRALSRPASCACGPAGPVRAIGSAGRSASAVHLLVNRRRRGRRAHRGHVTRKCTQRPGRAWCAEGRSSWAGIGGGTSGGTTFGLASAEPATMALPDATQPQTRTICNARRCRGDLHAKPARSPRRPNPVRGCPSKALRGPSAGLSARWGSPAQDAIPPSASASSIEPGSPAAHGSSSAGPPAVQTALTAVGLSVRR